MRWIYTDGRPHDTGEDASPTLKGDTIGHWDGDVLVADTVNVRFETTLGYNLPHSDQLHIVERFKRVDPDTLQVHIDIMDPVALTKTVSTTLTYKKADATTIQEYICMEQNVNIIDPDLVMRPDTRPQKHYGFDLPNPH